MKRKPRLLERLFPVGSRVWVKRYSFRPRQAAIVKGHTLTTVRVELEKRQQPQAEYGPAVFSASRRMLERRSNVC